jgi:hypothetical protein
MADMTLDEFRQRCREIAIVYRGQADEFDALADAHWLLGDTFVTQGISEASLIFERTQQACETLATELESDESE